MKYELIEKFLAESRQYFDLADAAGNFAEERSRQAPGSSGSRNPEQWHLSEASDHPPRSPE